MPREQFLVFHFSPKAAAAETMHEVSGALVAIVLVLCATFVPMAFLPGITGRLYQQFAATISISVVISGLVALTLTPALCGVLLKPHTGEPTLFGIRFFHPFNVAFGAFADFYTWLVRQFLRFWPVTLMLFAGIVSAGAWMFHKRPTALVPDEDQGYFISVTMLPEGASVQRTEASGRKVLEQVGKIPEIAHSFMLVGMDFSIGGAKSSTATMFTPLQPWDKRKGPGQDAVSVNKKLTGQAGMAVDDGVFLAFNPPVFRGVDKFDYYIQSREKSQDPAKLAQVVGGFLAELSKHKEVVPGRPSLSVGTPQIKIDVDEAKALAMGMSLPDVYGSLQAAMGSAYINDFNIQGRTFRVQVQADAAKRAAPEDLSRIQVRTQGGQMAPLSTVLTVRRTVGPDLIDRFNNYLGSKITNGDTAPGVSSSEGIKIVEEVAAKTLPEGYSLQWIGQARQEKKAGAAVAGAIGFSVLMVFLIMAAQYEKWSLPLAVIVSVPFAFFGAVLALTLRGGANDLYFTLGLITLVGLDAKNGILIVEFAQQMREQGMSARDAAVAAVRQRIRPIMMTSMAFVLGVAPLVWATGPGSAGRRSLGIGVFGGMLAATFITTLFIPLFFTMFSGKAVRRSEAETKTGTAEAEK
jgi:HAE1 family hydrophobic/amphiphilic exporter-1/multidrug efflux pump